MTTISIKNPTWKRLNTLKTPGKSMEEIISFLLDFYEEKSKKERTDPEPISDELFKSLLEELHVEEEELEHLVRKSRESFKGGLNA